MTKGRSGRGPRGLSRESILLAAVDLLEDGGEQAFSLRKVGAAAGCDAMSVTYHFGSKEGLNQALAGWLDDQVRPGREDVPWRPRLRHIADQYRRVALRYPATFPLLQRYTSTGPADHLSAEVVHRALADAGVPERRIVTTTLGWYAVVIGLAMGEVSGLIAPVSTAVADELAGLPDADFPLTKRLIADYRDVDPSAVFSSTLEHLLDGIASSSD